MPLDGQSLVSGGSVTAWAAIYVVISLYVTGPLVGERTIERLGWIENCSRALTHRAAPSPSQKTPPINCQALLGWMGDKAQSFCQHYGNPTLPDIGGLAELQTANRSNAERWLGLNDDNASQCHCAVNVTLSRERVAFALYAGSARVMSPSPVRTLSQELETSLNSAVCTGRSHQGGAP